MYEEEVNPGLDEVFIKGRIKMVPNPSNGIFELILDEDYVPIQTIQIFNSLGTLIYQDKNLQSNKVNLKNAVSGIYFVKILLEDKRSFTGKLIVK